MQLGSSSTSSTNLSGMTQVNRSQFLITNTLELSYSVLYSTFLPTSCSFFLQTGPSVSQNNVVRPSDRIKIALSLYKVQENIYLLDFQRLEVLSHLPVNLCLCVCIIPASRPRSTLRILLSTFKASSPDTLHYNIPRSTIPPLTSSPTSPPHY
jgi:hypothetical protein